MIGTVGSSTADNDFASPVTVGLISPQAKLQ